MQVCFSSRSWEKWRLEDSFESSFLLIFQRFNFFSRLLRVFQACNWSKEVTWLLCMLMQVCFSSRSWEKWRLEDSFESSFLLIFERFNFFNLSENCNDWLRRQFLSVSSQFSRKVNFFQFVWKLWKLATKTFFKLLLSQFSLFPREFFSWVWKLWQETDFLNWTFKDCIFLRKHFSEKWHNACQLIFWWAIEWWIYWHLKLDHPLYNWDKYLNSTKCTSLTS